jgi:uncharacterized membrane protein
MAYNPYEPPRADDVWRPPTLGMASGQPLPWTIEEALAVGWDRVKQWWPVLVLGAVGVNIASSVVSQVLLRMGFPLLGNLVSLLLSLYLAAGLLRAVMSAVRGEAPSFGQLLSGGDRLLPLLGTIVLGGLCTLAGFVVFVIPGIVLSLGLSLTYFACIDEQLGPVEALKRSWALTDGCKLQLFGFGLIALVVMLAGLLALVVGVFVAIPLLYVAGAWIYTRRRGEPVPDRLG